MELYLTKNFNPPLSATLKCYLKNGGFKTAEKALTSMSQDAIINQLQKSGLRGRGGAGFPTGLKWSFISRNSKQTRYICCNFDESEPGTFKDRQILENEPHQLIEGLIIGAYALAVNTVYIYIRGEYTQPAKILQTAIDEAEKSNYLGQNIFGSGFDLIIYVHRGAGAYVCGEETGLMESIEGKRGHPRIKPPFPAGRGLWGEPTTINNVETFCHVKHIIEKGSDWFNSIGVGKSQGNTIFSISGHVNKPGAYELPLGFNLNELIFDIAGGIRNNNNLKAIIPGGSSTKVIPAYLANINMDHESLNSIGTSLGTGAIMVMDHTTCMVRVGIVLSKFYQHESCGQCSSCREGTAWMNMILKKIENGEGQLSDIDLLHHVAVSMDGTAICALSEAASWPIQGLIKHFREEFEQHITLGKCPFPDSFEC